MQRNFIIKVVQEWRNWQTRRLQVPVVARSCGFKSHLLHFFCLNMVNNIPQHLISKILRDFYYIAVREVSVTLLLFTSDLINIHISDRFYKHCLCTAVIILTDILQCQVNIIIHQINAVIVDHISVRICDPMRLHLLRKIGRASCRERV